jgi:endonuclease-3
MPPAFNFFHSFILFNFLPLNPEKNLEMDREEKYRKVIDWFREHMPVAESELGFRNPYELLVAVVLSAQCTDKRVNMITPELFKRFPTPKHLSQTDEKEVYEYIKSCTYPNSKARHLVELAKKITSDFGGKVPSEVDQLLTLPGVGRKSANVIASVAFKKAVMPVDTHVHRVAARLGLTVNAKTPLETEKQLMSYIPEKYVAIAHHWLILHGRYICIARKPKCGECGLRQWCDYYAENFPNQKLK